jgi:uncharacterized membrane protein YraQ (UPF0718 family)
MPPPPPLSLLRRHGTLIGLAAVGTLAGLLVWATQGPAGVAEALGRAGPLLLAVLPAMLAGLLLAASLKQLIPPDALAAWMGAESGWRGLLIASAAGMATPGGPMAAFPLVLVLAQAGADRGALVCFVVSWSLNGLQRVLVWEVPLLGADFALLRFLCGLPLGVLAGLLARRVPIAWTPPDRAPPAAAAAARGGKAPR